MTDTDIQGPWHVMGHDAVFDALACTPHGLSDTEAGSRFARFGPNSIDVVRPAPVWRLVLDQLRSVVVALLGVAMLVAWLIGDTAEAVAILAVLVLNTGIGFSIELRARRAMEALLGLDIGQATVLRDGRHIEVDARTVVPGDIVLLEAGASVPTDARLLHAAELRVDEAVLTGESATVDKRSDSVLAPGTPLADRTNMVFKGTVITHGSGRAVAVATGAATEIGRLGRLTSGLADEKTPLELKLDVLGRRLVVTTLAIALAIIGIGLARGFDVLAMIEAGVALAIAAVPEGLPAVATITLGLGLRRMARRNALIRRLPAVEALGSATTICTDKTGTLTAGRMTVRRIRLLETDVIVTGTGYDATGHFEVEGGIIEPASRPELMAALRIGLLTNRARVEPDGAGGWIAHGDPTEAALVVAARKAGLTRESLAGSHPERAAVPFSSERRFMATTHETPEGVRTYVKGDPAQLVDRCVRALSMDGITDLDDAARDRLAKTNLHFARSGLRVLMLAFSEGTDAGSDLTFVALVGMMDPPVEGVDATIRRFNDAGVRTIMITGDQRPTAEAVARELGLMRDGDRTLDGRDLADMSDDQLAGTAAEVAAFCRVSPTDKLRIITALQSRGEIVAMLGDGVNDAAALRKASIGVAMGGRGSDIAREAADVVLRDDRLETVGVAIEEGRVIFDNIRKVVFYLFSCNLAEVLVLAIAMAGGLPLPLLPLQILWLNLVTDTFPAFALALEPAEPGVMCRPPRNPEAAFLSRSFMTRVSAFAGLITIAALGAFLAGLVMDPDKAVTMCFSTLAFAQILHLGNARSRGPVVSARLATSNPWAIGAFVTSAGLQVLAVGFPPLRSLLAAVPLTLEQWLLVVGLAATPALAGQLGKLTSRSRAAGTGTP